MLMEQEDITKLLNMALVFEEEFPSKFAEATAMIQDGKTGMELVSFLRAAASLDLRSTLHLRAALLHFTPKRLEKRGE
jgi:hypothetical protein